MLVQMGVSTRMAVRPGRLFALLPSAVIVLALACRRTDAVPAPGVAAWCGMRSTFADAAGQDHDVLKGPCQAGNVDGEVTACPVSWDRREVELFMQCKPLQCRQCQDAPEQ
jgi:hypothetical protein